MRARNFCHFEEEIQEEKKHKGGGSVRPEGKNGTRKETNDSKAGEIKV